MADNRFGAKENLARYDRAMQGIVDFAKEYPEKAAILAQYPELIKTLVVGGTADPKRNIVDRKDLDLIFDLAHIETAAKKKGLVNAYDFRDYVNALEYLQGHINNLRAQNSGLYDMQAMIDRPLPGPVVDISKDVRQALFSKPKPAGKVGIAAALASGAGAASAGDFRQAAGDIAESFLPLAMTPAPVASGTISANERARQDAAYAKLLEQQRQQVRMTGRYDPTAPINLPTDYRAGGRVRMI